MARADARGLVALLLAASRCASQFSGGLGLGGGLPGLGGAFGAGGGAPLGSPPLGGMRQQQAGQVEPPEDMGCDQGPHKETWHAVRASFRALFPPEGGIVEAVPREKMLSTLEGAMRDLKQRGALAPDTAGECGLGRLTLQMLTIASLEDPMALVQVFSETEVLASPVLTVVLDIPYVAFAQSGWPVLAFLSQINLRKRVDKAINTEQIDGLDNAATKEFHAQMMAAASSKNDEGAAKLVNTATAFLEAPRDGGSALGTLTALAAQCTVLDVQERMQLLQAVQQGFRQTIGNPVELDIALSTEWPLWGLLHEAVDAFFTG